MGKQTFPEEFSHKIKVDKYHSQILIEITSTPNSLDEAKKIIYKSGAQVVETTHFSPKWILLKLDVKDMREVALKLTEHGFSIHGINAASIKL